MRLPFFLLCIAALLSWAALRLDRMAAAPAIAEAIRTAPAPEQAVPRAAAAPPLGSPAIEPALPLFRPATPPLASRTPAPGEVFVLVGLAGGPDARIAFVRDEADGRTFTVRAGEQVRDWTLEEIDTRCVVLHRQRRRETACLS